MLFAELLKGSWSPFIVAPTLLCNLTITSLYLFLDPCAVPACDPASTLKVLTVDSYPNPTSIVLVANVLGKLTVTAPFVTFCFGYTASSIKTCTVSPSK